MGRSPAARGASRVAYAGAFRQLVLFGGLVGNQPNGETWIREGGVWRLADSDLPPPRNVHSMAYDPARRRVVLYAGIGTDGRLNDLWEWDGNSWLQP